jgi:hypothetical protein
MTSNQEDLLGKPAPHPIRTYDLFSVLPSASSAEPYHSPYEITSKLLDGRFAKDKKQIYIGMPHKGILNDSTFGPFVSLSSTDSDKYIGKEKPVKKQQEILIPFKMSSPPKKPYIFFELNYFII